MEEESNTSRAARLRCYTCICLEANNKHQDEPPRSRCASSSWRPPHVLAGTSPLCTSGTPYINHGPAPGRRGMHVFHLRDTLCVYFLFKLHIPFPNNRQLNNVNDNNNNNTIWADSVSSCGPCRDLWNVCDHIIYCR